MKTEQEIRDKIAEYSEAMSSKNITIDATLLRASAIHALQWVLNK